MMHKSDHCCCGCCCCCCCWCCCWRCCCCQRCCCCGQVGAWASWRSWQCSSSRLTTFTSSSTTTSPAITSSSTSSICWSPAPHSMQTQRGRPTLSCAPHCRRLSRWAPRRKTCRRRLGRRRALVAAHLRRWRARPRLPASSLRSAREPRAGPSAGLEKV